MTAREPTACEEQPTNVLIVGVGGQGVILVSKTLAALCMERGLEVKQNEVHGMAKRGGSVFSHVRFGRQVWSPTIARGEADILVALEWAEGLRWLPYLRPGRGVFLADTQRIVPPFACLDRRFGSALRYSAETPAQVAAHVGLAYAMDATRIAEAAGNARAANAALLGALSTALGFPAEDWERALAQFVPPRTVGANLEAFRRGRAWIEQARERPAAVEPAPAPAPREAPMQPSGVRLEITRQWCKSCDICVKLCPERCLVLDADRIVELAQPERCTGCRLCEWLCPDFAIRVHVEGPRGLEAVG